MRKAIRFCFMYIRMDLLLNDVGEYANELKTKQDYAEN